jgi:hypothetical protein
MSNGRWEQKFTGDDYDLYVANEAGASVRALAEQHGISKSVMAARIARTRKRLDGETPRRRRSAAAGDPTPVADRAREQDSPSPRAHEELVPTLERAYTYSDWLDDRDYAAGRITARELARRRAPRAMRAVRL